MIIVGWLNDTLLLITFFASTSVTISRMRCQLRHGFSCLRTLVRLVIRYHSPSQYTVVVAVVIVNSDIHSSGGNLFVTPTRIART